MQNRLQIGNKPSRDKMSTCLTVGRVITCRVMSRPTNYVSVINCRVFKCRLIVNKLPNW